MNKTMSGAAFRAWYDALDEEGQTVAKRINAQVLFEPEFDNVSVAVSRAEVHERTTKALAREMLFGSVEGGIIRPTADSWLSRLGLWTLALDLIKTWWADSEPSPAMVAHARLWADDVFAEIKRALEHAGSDVSYSEHDDGAELAAFVDRLDKDETEGWVWRP